MAENVFAVTDFIWNFLLYMNHIYVIKKKRIVRLKCEGDGGSQYVHKIIILSRFHSTRFDLAWLYCVYIVTLKTVGSSFGLNFTHCSICVVRLMFLPLVESHLILYLDFFGYFIFIQFYILLLEQNDITELSSMSEWKVQTCASIQSTAIKLKTFNQILLKIQHAVKYLNIWICQLNKWNIWFWFRMSYRNAADASVPLFFFCISFVAVMFWMHVPQVYIMQSILIRVEIPLSKIWF